MLHRVAAIQLTSGHEVLYNLNSIKKQLEEAVDENAQLVVLPENFAIMGLTPNDKIKYREEFGHGMIQDFLSEQANDLGIWIVGGTIPIAVPHDHEKVYASCLVFNDKGERVARYDKIHLFDVEIPSHQESYQESQTIEAGNEIVVLDTPFGKLGLAVCYDLRFPELFRQLQVKGAEIIALPSAFTVPTGMAHWEILVRARAIENQVYMIAAAQTGTHSSTRKTYGHSMIVNPWGEVKARLADDVGVIETDIDLHYLRQLREDFPVLKHRRS